MEQRQAWAATTMAWTMPMRPQSTTLIVKDRRTALCSAVRPAPRAQSHRQFSKCCELGLLARSSRLNNATAPW
jgi:hypothetical protein